MNNSVPIIKPHKMKEYEFKQSKYDVAPRIPFSQIVVGPSVWKWKEHSASKYDTRYLQGLFQSCLHF